MIVLFWQRLFDPAYLYALNAQPQGAWSANRLITGAAILLGLLTAWWWVRRSAAAGGRPLAPRIMLGAGGAALALLIAQTHMAGLLSARVWYISAITVGLLAPFAHWVIHWPWPAQMHSLGRALALAVQPSDPLLPPIWQAAWGLVHLGSLYTLAVHEGLGWWPGLIALACLLLAWWAERTWARETEFLAETQFLGLRVELFTPLVLPYATSFLRWLVIDDMGVNVAPYAAFPYPDPWSPWFDLRIMLVAGIAGLILTTGAFVIRCRGVATPRPYRRTESRTLNSEPWLPGVGLLVLGLTVYVATIARHLSHGAAGSDPSCYLQMALDLARRGTALHTFPLTEVAHEAGVTRWPIVPVGYHPPLAGAAAATVWPIGWPLLLAPLAWLGGEAAALWGAPLFMALSALLVWQVVREMAPRAQRHHALLAGGLAAWLLLTAHEAVLRSLVPMADAAAQALSLLTLLCLLRAQRRDALGWSAAAGLALAATYTVRHPQLFLGLAALPALWGMKRSRVSARNSASRRLGHLAVFGLAALLGSAPDLLYHATVFGSPWIAESSEWSLLSIRHIGPTAMNLFHDGLLRRNEFGYLWPLILVGAWQQANQPATRRHAMIMAAGLGAVLLFHLSYSALRWRDLIPLFPWLALWAAIGLVAWWERTAASPSRRALLVILVLVTSSARTAETMWLPWQEQLSTFGHITRMERSAYDELARLLPPNTVVGAGLSSGAIQRYTGHEAVRPAAWSKEDLKRFGEALVHRQRPLYLLDDGDEMARLVAQHAGNLRPIAALRLPVFGPGGEPLDRPAILYAPVKPLTAPLIRVD